MKMQSSVDLWTMMTKHQKEIKLFKHAPVRPFWKLKTFFFCYLQWHDWSGLAFWSWFWQFTWDQLLWFPVASQQIPIGSTFVTFVKSWDLFHKEITFCFRTMALNTVLNRPPYEQNFPAHLSKYLSHTWWRILSSKLFTFSPFWETAKNVSGVVKNFFGHFCQKADETSGQDIPNPKNRLQKYFLLRATRAWKSS